MIIGDDRIGLLDGVKSSDCSNKKITGKVRTIDLLQKLFNGSKRE